MSEASLLRSGEGHARSRVTFIELFFDLVFVFAITQLAHALAAHFTFLGAAQTALLFLAVWWMWIDTSWISNWLDPETAPVRMLLLALMLVGLTMSAALPQAFGPRAGAFAGAYVFAQLTRDIFMMSATRGPDPGNYRNFQRITLWHGFAGVFWIVGALCDAQTRLAAWALAAALETAGPAFGFWTPRLGRSRAADWDISGAHLAERCGLFILIALGESVLDTGAGFAELAWNGATISAFAASFLSSVAMWRLYFLAAEHAAEQVRSSRDPGRLARSAYTYTHQLIVAGVIVSAVADEFVLTHPGALSDGRVQIAAAAGPAIYLSGLFLFKRTVFNLTAYYQLLAIAALGAAAFAAPYAPAHLYSWATSLIVSGAALWGARLSARRIAGA